MAAQNLYNIGLFTNIGAVTIPSYIDYVVTEGFSVSGLGAATYSVTANTGATTYRKQSLDGRWWQLNVYQAFAEMFGAKGDGTTDDASAINAALLFTPRLYLKNSVYAIGSPINLQRGNVLSGDDLTFDDQPGNGSHIVLLNASNCRMITTPASRSVASFTISIATTTATVVVATGTIELNGQINAAGISNFTRFLTQLTGPTGGSGTYTVSVSQTLSIVSGTSNAAPTEFQGLDHFSLDGNASNQSVANFAIDWQGLFVGSWIDHVFVKNNRGPAINISRSDLYWRHFWALKNVCIPGDAFSNYAVETNYGINSTLLSSINGSHIYIENTLNVLGGDRSVPSQRGYGINLNRVSAMKLDFWNPEGCVTAIDLTSCGVIEIGVADSTAMGYNSVTDAAFYRFMDSTTKQFSCGKIVRQGFETGILACGKATAITSDYIPNVGFNGDAYFPGYEFNADAPSFSKWYGRGQVANQWNIGRIGSSGYSELQFYTDADSSSEYVFNRAFGSGIYWTGSNRLQPVLTGTAATVAGSVVTLDGSPDLSALFNPGHSTPTITLTNATNGLSWTIVSADNVAKTVTVTGSPSLSASPTAWTIPQQEVVFWSLQSFGNKADHCEVVQPLVLSYRDTTSNFAERSLSIVGVTGSGSTKFFPSLHLNSTDTIPQIFEKHTNQEPNITPPYVGYFWLDGAVGTLWLSNGTSSSSNWQLASYISKKSNTAGRPILSALDGGYRYFDTDLAAAGKPIWWTGTAWVDATGAVV